MTVAPSNTLGVAGTILLEDVVELVFAAVCAGLCSQVKVGVGVRVEVAVGWCLSAVRCVGGGQAGGDRYRAVVLRRLVRGNLFQPVAIVLIQYGVFVEPIILRTNDGIAFMGHKVAYAAKRSGERCCRAQ